MTYDLAVVVPVYGNADALVELHTRLRRTLAECGVSAELIFVDDASPDDADVVLAALAAGDPHVRIATLPTNGGQQRAIAAGLRITTAPWVAVLDADLQDPPEALPQLLHVASTGRFDAVFAGRRGRYESPLRLLTGRMFKWVIHVLTGLPRDAGGYVLMSRRMVDRVCALGGQPYLAGMIGSTRLPATSVPVPRMQRPSGTSAYTPTMRLGLAVRALHHILTTWRQPVNPRRTSIERHNKVQRQHYVDPEVNPRMRPVDSPYVQRHLERLLQFGGVTPRDRILDVGCGMGKFTLPLIERGYQVEGLDLSPELLEAFRRRLPVGADVPLHCHDVLERPEQLRGRFDVVVGFFVLHHLLDLTESFRALRHYLRPGGAVVFLEPNAFNPLYYAQITLTPGMSWRSDKGLISMRRSKLVSALTAAGYRDVRHHRSGMFPPAVTNREQGRALEDRLDRLRVLEPVSAFQVLSGISPGVVDEA